jgi:hypothetical protein
MASGEEGSSEVEPPRDDDMLGRMLLGCGEMVSVLVLIVVLTETTECLRGWRELRREPVRSSEDDSSPVLLLSVSSSDSSSRSVSSSSLRPLAVGEAEMSVETEVL